VAIAAGNFSRQPRKGREGQEESTPNLATLAIFARAYRLSFLASPGEKS
jgi:hypothetical protein